MSVAYTCNAVHKDKARVCFCQLPLDHEDMHRDGEVTWAEPAWDNGFDV